MFLQEHLSWETNNPLGYQHFLNSQFGDDNTTIYKCVQPYFRLLYTLFDYGYFKPLCVNVDDTKTHPGSLSCISKHGNI